MSDVSTKPDGDAGLESEVLRRYARGAEEVEPGLCCATGDYEADHLEVLPAEIIEKDYGCGDPSRWAVRGDTVLDLGSGAGKVCYILSQKVGPEGAVIGADFNDAMLEVARKHRPDVAAKIGWDNVRFVKARIQDLALDLERVEGRLQETPVRSVSDLAELEETCRSWRANEPLVRDASVDLVVSNCVLNLVKPEDKERLFREIHRVLKRGGRAVISDVVCDEPPTDRVRNDPELWSGCIAGAFVEHDFLERFERAGFYGVEILERAAEPWQVLDGVEFRSMTVRALKGKEGPCFEHDQAVVYRGPFASAHDDDGHEYPRGRRIAVCGKTFDLLTNPSGPYAGMFEGIEPLRPVAPDSAAPFDCNQTPLRDPAVTKGDAYVADRVASGASCCAPSDTECCG